MIGNEELFEPSRVTPGELQGGRNGTVVRRLYTHCAALIATQSLTARLGGIYKMLQVMLNSLSPKLLSK